MNSKILILLTMSCFLIDNLFGQDISQIYKSKAFSWQGNLNGGLSSINNSQSTQYSPFAYYLGANVNLNIYGIQVPLSFIYRDRTGNYNNPFNRFSISPNYKWAKLHLGHCSLNFNPYTLSGIQIFGAGIELNPGKIRIAVVKGELKNTKIIIDTLNDHSGILNPYRRDALGIKLGVGSISNYFDIMLLTGKDKLLLDVFKNDSIVNKQQSNTTIGTSLALAFFKKKVNLKINVAASGYTYDQNGKAIDQSDLKNNSYLRKANEWFTINQSTGLYFARDAALNINLGGFSFGGKYQRIDPQYNSFGIFYIRGDIENYTINSNMNFLNSKVNLSGSYGVNRNNISGLRKTNTKQKIYNINLNLSPLSWMGLDLQLSNFNFDQQPVIAHIEDSLRYVQVNKTNSVNPYFTFNNKTASHNLYINYTSQSVFDITNENSESENSTLNSYSIGYSLKNKIKKFGLTTSLFLNDNDFNGIVTQRKGVSIGGNKLMFKSKINNRLRITYSINSQDHKDQVQYNLNLSTMYSYSKKGSISLQSQYGVRPNFKNNEPIKEIRIAIQLNILLK